VVSYVVNDGPRPVSQALHAKVTAAIDELGYRPNRIARALSLRHSSLLGLAIPDSQNAFFSELGLAIEQAAFERGYLVLLGNTTASASREAHYVRAFVDSGADGLLVASSLSGAALARLLPEGRPFCVAVHRRPAKVHASSVVADDCAGGTLATMHLLGHGHPDVACIAGGDRLDPVAARVKGWQSARLSAGLEKAAGVLVTGFYDRYGGYKAAERLFTEQPRTSAIFAATDEQAIGVLRAAADSGRRIPDDVALVGFDGVRESSFTVPALTTVLHPIKSLGRNAVEEVLKWINGEVTQASHIVLPVELQIGQSCGCDVPGVSSR
jgi:LacI family transcriptional regulator